MFRHDPGPCPICGAAHSACRSDSGPITVAQLPNRDALEQLAAADAPVAHQVQATLPPGQHTSGTYRGTKKRP